MSKLVQKVRRYPFSTAIIIVVWVLSLMPVPETPLDGIKFIDKWTHIVMYGGVSFVVWVEWLRRHSKPRLPRLVLVGWLMPVLMGGLLELIQAYCTGGRRNGDWMDFIANTAGATLILCVGTLWVWCRAKGHREGSEEKSCKTSGRR